MLDYSKIEAVIFDLGRVLIDVQFEHLFKSAEDKIRAKYSTMDAVLANPVFVEHSTGKIDSTLFYRKLTQQLGLELDAHRFFNEWCSIFSPITPMLELMQTLNKKMPVGLLSDTDPVHWAFICEHWPEVKEIKNPVLSYEIGVMKPNFACYKKAALAVKKTLENCLFIDDRLVNVQGAQQAGMQSFQHVSILDSKEKLAPLL